MHKLDTLFLDRDGVINVKLDGRYVQNANEFEFMPGAIQIITKLSKVFKKILVVTNQQGIGKGIMSIEQLDNLHLYMRGEIEKSGGKIDKIYYCPHLAAKNCSCRKPNSGMIKQAFIDFPDIKREESYLIGDSDSDIEAGNKENIKTVKVDDKYTLSKWGSELLSVIE